MNRIPDYGGDVVVGGGVEEGNLLWNIHMVVFAFKLCLHTPNSFSGFLEGFLIDSSKNKR